MSDDAIQTDDPIPFTDSCTPAGGECVRQTDPRACSGFVASQLVCSSEAQPEGERCCLDPIFAACREGQTFPLRASDYDQSCDEDSDCLGIGEGDGCRCDTLCSGAAINVADEARWRTDLEKTPAYQAKLVCNCPAFFGVGCVDHRCARLQPGMGL
jgi:hypothetical protein